MRPVNLDAAMDYALKSLGNVTVIKTVLTEVMRLTVLRELVIITWCNKNF